MTLVSDLQYFSPSIFYFNLIKSTHCIFDQYEHFQKMSFMNRCTLLGANGPVNLSIPLIRGRNQKTVIKDVRILNSDRWQDRHWKTITSCYNKSPWFDDYRDSLQRLYLRQFDFLIEWDIKCFEWVCDKLSINTRYSLTGKFVLEYESEYVDFRGMLKPATINQQFPDPERYPQVFEDRFGFVPNLSVLDYLFCVGPKSGL